MKIFYLSPASGAQFSVVFKLKYPYVLVNFMTKLRDYAKQVRQYCKVLMIDSGGFPLSFIHNGYNIPDYKYLAFVKTVKADYFVLRDYPCEPQILRKYNVTAKDQIHRTLDHHLKLLEFYERSNVVAIPIPVIQGWEIDDYLYCIDLYKEHGLIGGKFNYVAIGTTCRRRQVKITQRIILTVRSELPNKIKLHAFGVKLSVLNNKAVWDALYSTDSSAWDYKSYFQPINHYRYCVDFINKINALREKFEKVKTLDEF